MTAAMVSAAPATSDTSPWPGLGGQYGFRLRVPKDYKKQRKSSEMTTTYLLGTARSNRPRHLDCLGNQPISS